MTVPTNYLNEILNYCGEGGAIFLRGNENNLDNLIFINNTAESYNQSIYEGIYFTKTQKNQTHYIVNVYCNHSLLTNIWLYEITKPYDYEDTEIIYTADFTLSDDKNYSYMTNSWDIKKGDSTFTIDDNITVLNLTFVFSINELHLFYLYGEYFNIEYDYYDGFEDYSQEYKKRFGYGGAIACYNSHDNNITNSKFYNNSADDYGGSIFVSVSELNISNCEFINSSSSEGNVIYLTNHYKGMEFEMGADCTVNIKDSYFNVTQAGSRIIINYDKPNSDLYVQFVPGNNMISGIYNNQSTLNVNNVKVNDFGLDIIYNNANYTVVNTTKVTVEMYDGNWTLIDNATYNSLDAKGFIKLNSTRIFDEKHPVRYIHAYHLEDKYYKASDNEYAFTVGEFDKLQFLINQLGNNSVLKLEEDVIYSLGLDTITEGIVINKTNITIDGNGHTINAKNQSRIFKILGNGSKLINLKFTNATDGAVYYDNVTDAVIQNVKFVNNQAVNGTVYFNGGNLTINNAEFINSTTKHNITDENGNKLNNYSGTALLYANATGNIIISSTNFTDSIFGDLGFNIANANTVKFEDTVFKNNLAYDIEYDLESDEPYIMKIYPGKSNSEIPNRFIFINSTNVEFSNVNFKNNTLSDLISIEANNTKINNFNITDSTVSVIFDVLNLGSADLSNIYIENISSLFYTYYWDSSLNDYVYEAQTESGEVINIMAGNYNENLGIMEYGNTNCSLENFTFTNVFYDFSMPVRIQAANITLENVNLTHLHPEHVDIMWNGEYYDIEKDLGMYEFFSIFGKNLNVSDIYVSDINVLDFIMVELCSEDSLNLNNIRVYNTTVAYCSMPIIMVDAYENATVNISSLIFDNLTTGLNQTRNGEWEYESGEGISVLYAGGGNATIKDITVKNSYINRLFDSNVKNLNMSDISVYDCSILEDQESFNIQTMGNVTLNNILLNNFKLLPMINIYSQNGIYEYNEYLYEDASFGMMVESKGNIFLNNITIINMETLGQRPLLEIYAIGNITTQNMLIENISNGESYNFNRESEEDTVRTVGIANNAIEFYSENGAVEILNVTINNVSNGIGWRGYNWVYNGNNYDRVFFFDKYDYFLYVTGLNTTIDNLTIKNARIGGLENGTSIYINATNYLTVNNFIYTNITSGVPYNVTMYNETLGRLIWDYYESTGDAGIVLQAGKNADISNIIITNTTGGGMDGIIYLISNGNASVENIIIRDIESKQSKSIKYDPVYGDYVVEVNTKDSRNDGIVIETVGDVTLNNINISDYNIISADGSDYLIFANAGNNLTVNNVNMSNIKEKQLAFISFDNKLGRYYYIYTTGLYSPSLSFGAGENATVTNINVLNVEFGGVDTFLSVSGNNTLVENITMKDSKLSAEEGNAIEISAENYAVVKNINADNITGLTGRNTTATYDYYNVDGDYEFSELLYEYEYGNPMASFGISINSKVANASNINITNSVGSVVGLLEINSVNITVDNVLIENISAFTSYSMEFGHNLRRYICSYIETMGNVAFVISNNTRNVGDSIISNIKINNLSATNKKFISIYNSDISMENVTVSNVTIEPATDYEYNFDLDKIISDYYSNSFEDFFVISAVNNLNIINMLIDNLPCNSEGILINATNVTINNATVKNIKSESYSMEYDYNLNDYIMVGYTNDGNVMVISGNKILIENSLFENITVAGHVLVFEDSNSTLNNCTFLNINSQRLNEFYIIDGELVNNSANSTGSTIFTQNFILINGSKFINCSSDYGGALYISVGNYYISNSLFQSNKATYGGAIYFNQSASNNTVFNSTFIENLAIVNGGALYLFESNNDENVINISTFLGNHAVHDGGAYFYNNTFSKVFFDDYEWFNRTAMFSDGKLSYTQDKTKILNSLFENNTDHELKIIAKNIAEGINQTVIITINVDADGEVSVNITDENGNYLHDLNGNELKNMNYTLVNGSVSIPLGILPIGVYTVSAYHNNYNFQYDSYYNYAYHYNSTIFYVYEHFLNVTANETIFADENITIEAKLNSNVTGTVNITVTNATHTLTFNNIPVVNGIVNYNIAGFWAGEYSVNVTYNGDDIFYVISNNTARFTVLQRESLVNVTVLDTHYGENATVIVQVPKTQTGNVTIKINNKEYTKEITDGKAEFIIGNLTVQKWDVNVTFAQNRVFKQSNNNTTFNVIKADLKANITGKNITVLDNPQFTIEVPSDFKGNVSIIVDNQKYNGTVEDLIELGKLLAGNKTAEIIFYGDSNYNDLTLTVNFTVERINSTVTAEIKNITYLENATAIITVTGNANGTVEITVDGETFIGTVENGKATVNLTDLSAGEKEALIKFITNDYYNMNSTAAANFTVFKANSTLIITKQGKDVIITTSTKATGNIIVYVNGKEYSAEIRNNQAKLENILNNTETSVVALYEGDLNYTKSRNSTVFTETVQDSLVNITAPTITYGEDAIITVKVPVLQTGFVTITLNNNNYSSKIINGEVKFNITGLNAGDYNITVLYEGNVNYNTNKNSTMLHVLKANLTVNVIAENITVNDTAKFIINTPYDFKGKVNITVDNITYSGDIKLVLELQKLTKGDKQAVLVFYNDNNYNQKTVTVNFKVKDELIEKAQNNINVTVADDKITVTVSDNATGNVTVKVGNKTYNTAVGENGTATIVLNNITPGTYNVTVIYAGDDNNNITFNTTINVDKYSTPVSIDVNSTVVGNITKVVVTVPSGVKNKVSIVIDGKTFTNATENGIATFYIAGLTAGNKTIVAAYAGDSEYVSNSTTANFTVSKIKSSVTVKVDSISVGETAVINITSPNDINGIVIVSVNGTNYTVIVSEGKGSLSVDKLGNGTYNINATYLENGKYLESINSTTLTVSKVTPEITVNSCDITLGDNLIVKVTLPDDVTGTVTVKANSTTVTVGVTGGENTILIPGLAVGKYSVNVTYNGNDKYLSVNKSTVITVKPVNTTKDDIEVDDLGNGTVIVTVPENSTGNVTVKIGNETYNATISENGTAVIDLTNVTPGEHNITVIYSGDENNTGVTFNTTIDVAKYLTLISIDVNSTVVGNITKVTVTVPSGIKNNVTVEIDGKAYTNATENGVATFYIADLTAGDKTIVASYAGDSDYVSNSTTETFTVSKNKSDVGVKADSISVGETAVINITAPNDINGIVIVSVNGTNYTVIVSEGKGSVEVTKLGNGTYNINVTYLENGKYLESISSTTLTVSKVTPEITVESGDITLGDNLIVKVTLPDDVTGTVTVKANSTTVTVGVTGGENTILIPGLAVGKYGVNVIYNGNDKYLSVNTSAAITVKPVNTTKDDVKVDDLGNGTVIVTVPENATGNVTVKVGNETYNATISENGTAVIDLTNVTPGDHNITVIYSGDENNTGVTFNTTINVAKYLTPISIDVNSTVVGNITKVTVTVPSGIKNNVTVEIDGKTYTNATENGIAVFNIKDLTAGDKTIVATYAGDSDYLFNSTTAVFTVSKNNSTVSVKTEQIKVGETAVINITAPSDFNGTAVVSVNGTNYSVEITNGKGSVEVSKLDNGTYDIGVRLLENDKYLSSTNETALTVSKVTDDNITSSVKNSTLGEPVEVTVTLPDDAAGTVTVKINNNTVTVPVAGGNNTILVPGVPVGTHEVEITYNGNDKYEPVSTTDKITVKPVNTTENDVKVDDLGNGTVIVTVPENATGDVTVKIGNETYNSTISENGTAVIDLTNVTPGDHNITVIYSGDENNTGVTFNTTIDVAKYLTPISIDVNSTVVGNITKVIVTVPSGIKNNVTVEIDGKTYTNATENGIAVFNIKDLTAGDKTIVATYAGDSDYLFNSTTATFTVSKNNSTVSVKTEAINVGETAVINITAPSDFNGTAVVSVNGTNYSVEITNGKGSVEVSKLDNGTYDIGVRLLENDKYLSSTDKTALTVSKVTDANITSGVKNSTLGEPVEVTVTLPDDATGTVTVKINNNTVTVPVAGGNNTILVPGVPVGTHEVEITYNGDDKYEPVSTTDKVTVKPVNTTENDVKVDDLGNGTINITVPENATGNLTVIIDGKEVITVPVNGSDNIIQLDNLTPGNHTVIVKYSGDENHNPNVNVTTISIPKLSADINATGFTISEGESGIITVNVPEDATGIVMVDINANKYYGEITDGKANINVAGLNKGSYDAEVTYLGDDKYDKASTGVNVKVNPKDNPSEITTPSFNVTLPKTIDEGDSANVNVTLPENATGNVKVIVDGKEVATVPVKDGKAEIPLDNLTKGGHKVEIKYSGDDKYAPVSYSDIIIVNGAVKVKKDTILIANRTLTRMSNDFYKAGEHGDWYYVTLMDTDGNLLANKTIQIAINGVHYNLTTESDGRAYQQVNMESGNVYTYAFFFQGDDDYNAAQLTSTRLTVTKKATSITATNKVFKKTAKSKKITVTLKTINNQYDGKMYLSSGKVIKLTVNGKTYSGKTNSKNKVTFNIKLTKKGKYTAKIKFAGTKIYEKSSKKIKITVK